MTRRVGLPTRSRTRRRLWPALLGLTAAGAIAATAVLSWLSGTSGCHDSRQDGCGFFDVYQDIPLPEALERFGLTAPCGTGDLRYYADVAWNDGTEDLELRGTLTAACLNAFAAQAAPGIDLSRAPLLKPGDPAFPPNLSTGHYSDLDPGHTYRVVKARLKGGDVTLAVDTSTPRPVLTALFDG